MSIINIPQKSTGDTLSGDEVNTIVEGQNDTYREATKATYSLHGDHFVTDGTTTVGGEAVPVVKLTLNPDHFEIVNGMISIKAGLLA